MRGIPRQVGNPPRPPRFRPQALPGDGAKAAKESAFRRKTERVFLCGREVGRGRVERRGERKEEDGASGVTGSGKGDGPTGKTSGRSRGSREVFARRRGTAAFLRAAKKKIHAQYSAGRGVGRAGRGRVRSDARLFADGYSERAGRRRRAFPRALRRLFLSAGAFSGECGRTGTDLSPWPGRPFSRAAGPRNAESCTAGPPGIALRRVFCAASERQSRRLAAGYSPASFL